MTRFFKALAILLIALPATANDELLPVEEAFKYVVTDTGEAFEIDWAIYKHAYLYKSKLAFESATDGIVLGPVELPDGVDHEDEYFGKQEVYRDFFFVTIPYTVSGERPATADLVLKYQGCDENVGLCYMPMTVTETVTLKAVAQKGGTATAALTLK